jgi:hypothetical protein
MGKGKLLKYRTKEEQMALELKNESESSGAAPPNGQGGNKPEDGNYNRGATDGGGGGGPQQQQGTDPTGIKRMNSGLAKRQTELKKDGIAGEKGMQNLGFKDGKVECTYCWTVKRDVFDIPMLIVMNVSTGPCRSQLICCLKQNADCQCSSYLVSRGV